MRPRQLPTHVHTALKKIQFWFVPIHILIMYVPTTTTTLFHPMVRKENEITMRYQRKDENYMGAGYLK